MSIRPLPKDAVDKIKSSSAITSLNEVVCGLLRNSLDASSTKVNIHLDYVLGNCTVHDNGHGIEPTEFENGGGLGKLHHTSKIPQNPRFHGSHGNFLASVATFSLLTITSHHHRHDTQAALSVHNGKVLARHIPALPDQQFESFSHGTRVNVRDLFGSMPVRVKQRALMVSDRARIDKEWEALTRDVAALLLSWPSEVSISLREANTQREQRLKSTSADAVSRSSRIFAQAGLADREDAESWVPVSASCRRVRIKGAISMVPVATRRSQIMSLGIRPIPNSFGTNLLYEEVNKTFKGSNFGVVEDDSDDTAVKGKPRKGIERWPMFYLEIQLLGASESLAMDDVLGDSRRNLQAIIDLLKVVCYGFLKKNLLQPRHVQKINERPATIKSGQTLRPRSAQSRSEIQQSHQPSTAAALGSELRRAYSPFDGWSRIKVGRATTALKLTNQDGSVSPAEPTTRRLVGENGMLLRRPFDDVPDIEPISQNQPVDEQKPAVSTCMDDECLKITTEDDIVAPMELTTTADPKLQPREIPGRPKAQPQKWLQDILSTWKNPVFESTEPHIPALNQDPVVAEGAVDAQHDGPSSKFYGKEKDIQFEAAAMTLNGRLSRASLAKAEVIGQVDRKFLLLRLPLHTTKRVSGAEASTALIMLDQHAADERCRLEELMSQYFDTRNPLQAATELLERPIVFEASTRENELLIRFHSHFRTWGIVYKPRTVKDGNGIEIGALPPSILERCRTEPKIVIDLIRKEIWKLEDRNIPSRPVHESGRPWASSFHNCPQGILDLLHSRSCRSAIMFNDELSKDACAQLVHRLSQCAFPFQCAHGRPSCVPLVDIGSGSGRFGDWKQSSMNLGRWRGWLDVGR